MSNKLKDQLKTRLLKNYRGQEFLPVTAVGELVTEESIEECLRMLDLQHDAGFVSSIHSKASRIFTVLVFIGLEGRIKEFIDHDVFDDALPMDTENVPLGDQSNKVGFYNTQWKLPPVFDRSRYAELWEPVILPFLEKEHANHGSFGVIFDIKIADGHLIGYPTTDIFVLKTVVQQDYHGWDEIMREEEALRNRQHPNIVPLLASFILHYKESDYDRGSLNLILPRADMNMEEWLNLKKTPTALLTINGELHRQFLYEAASSLLSALSLIHRESSGMVTSHHDLKPKNVLVKDNVLQICDFGRAHLKPLINGSETEASSGLGSFAYHPPEYWNDDGSRSSQSHGRSFDVWSMGCIMVEMAILICYGWDSQMIFKFRQERLNNTEHPKRFTRRRSEGDDSFHNNMRVVQGWMSQMKRGYGSRRLGQFLDISESMLQMSPEKRISSWEAELDIYEILYPDESLQADFERQRLIVQGPRKGKNSRLQTPIHRAAMRGNKNRVIALLEAGWPSEFEGELGSPAWLLAENNGHTEIRDILCQNSKTSPDVTGPFQADLITASTSVIVSQDAELLTPLHWAARRSDLATIKSICGQSNARKAVLVLDQFSKIPLHYAAAGRSPELVRFLLKACPDIRACLTTQDANGKSPLHYAGQSGTRDVVLALLEGNLSEADKREILEQQDDNLRTPLHVAVGNGNTEVIQLLNPGFL